VRDWRGTIARWIGGSVPSAAPPADSRVRVVHFAGKRAYHAAQASRLTAGWTTSNTSADSELVSSLAALRSRSRALARDAAFAKRARVVVVSNVVGSGIGMQAQVESSRGRLYDAVNVAIEDAWCEWARADSCHTGGALAFAALERAAMGQVFEAGEVFIRKHYRPFGGSRVPFTLELIEAERLADEFSFGVEQPRGVQGIVRMGVEVDEFYRPIAYWIRARHPGESYLRPGITDRLERVPADQIIHLRLIDRWPQTRGEPWMHAVVRKLNDIDGYTEAEIIAARGAAAYMGTIESPETDIGEEQDDGTQELELTPGMVEKLAPGEKFVLHSPNRPNAQADPFIRLMLREVAAGIGVSYESLSRDYSQSNYSSSRLALLDDRDLWRMLQSWFIGSFRHEVHRDWLRQAVYARAIEAIPVAQYAADPRKFEAVRFKPRGWSWVDPTKEVEAFKEAIKAGLTTRTDVIAATGGGQDVEDIDSTRRRELDDAAAKGLDYDTDPEAYAPEPPPPSAGPPDDQQDDIEDDPPARVVSFGRRDA